MKYIAIRSNDFILITPEHNEQDLIAQGYTLYSDVEYSSYVQANSQLNQSEAMILLETKAEEYINFGESLWKEVRKKVWAINTYNISSGVILTSQQMMSLFSASSDLDKSLCTGSFKTAIDVCNLLKQNLPQYSSVADYTINELKKFMGII